MRDEKSICLVMNDNSYAGREYASALQDKGIFVDIILLGRLGEIEEYEESRCGNMWKPIRLENVSSKFTIYRFDSLNDPLFLEHLTGAAYALGIQGGTGILKAKHFASFSQGMISFHPGDLSYFRGCSAPEYQYLASLPVVSTCHFIAEGIDMGDIIEKRSLDLNMESYFTFRASIYPRTSEFLADVVEGWLSGLALNRVKQDESIAVYHSYIGDDAIEELINNWSN